MSGVEIAAAVGRVSAHTQEADEARRGLLEARQLLQAAECHTGGIDGRSGGSSARAAASTADAAHEIFARAAAASEVYTRVSKPLKPF